MVREMDRSYRAQLVWFALREDWEGLWAQREGLLISQPHSLWLCLLSMSGVENGLNFLGSDKDGSALDKRDSDLFLSL